MPHRDASNQKLRNIAIIAHVDHGKTTLVDSMFKQSGLFRKGQVTQERLMDTMDLEKERGITIAAKNCSIIWKDIKINILDTPGHADFGGEVERALSMVDGVILLVDAAEGPLPQTRFVLSKAMQARCTLIVVINKIDRQDARCEEVHSEIVDLLIDLDADDTQIDFPLFYAIGKDGIAQRSLEEKQDNLHLLLDAIIDETPAPRYQSSEPFQMLVSDISWSDYLGRLAIGKVVNASAHSRERLVCINKANKQLPLNISKIQNYQGLTLKETDKAEPGDIVVLSGIDEVHIGDTICTKESPKALPRIIVDEPTVSMMFYPNNSPISGKEGKFVQGSKLRERLHKEGLMNVSIHIEEDSDSEGICVKGRGEFQMVILIEMMRREGFEMMVGRPEVIYRYENGKKMEPIEQLFVDCADNFVGVVTAKLAPRKGRMVNLVNHQSGRVRIEFSLPSRALIGYRDEFLTDTKGTGILNSYLSGYEEYRGDFPERFTGSLISDRTGSAVAYALFNLEPRGTLFITPGDTLYEGMVIGEHNRDNDLIVNPIRTKKLSNHRAAGKDDSIALTPIMPMTLERGIQFIRKDELIEITPLSIRIRKNILKEADRKRQRKG